jgi:hypothetical protein
LLLVVVVAASACTTFNNARTLEPGQHAASLTLGGPLTNVPGVGPIPLPNITLEGRHGVMHHLDVNYGLHVLPLVFGVAGGHVGATGQFNEQDELIPVVSLGQRFFFFTNLLDGRKTTRKDAFAMSQTDLTASWLVYDQLLYLGASAYLPLDAPIGGGSRTLRLAPVVGVEVHPGISWLRLQLETRWLAPDVDQRFAVVDWISPDDKGGISINLGVAVVISDLLESMQPESAQ